MGSPPARALDEFQPLPGLLPADPERRRAMLEAERRGAELQNALRRLFHSARRQRGAPPVDLVARAPPPSVARRGVRSVTAPPARRARGDVGHDVGVSEPAGAERPPFEQVPFDELPERPPVPHPYPEAETAEVVVDSAPFGRVRTHVVLAGSPDAPPLLLVHGLMTSSYSWRYVLEPLGERFRLLVPDLPGCGRSDLELRTNPTGGALAAFVGELQDALGVRGCAAVGNSLGGYVCLRRALAEPASFSRLSVVHAPGLPEARLVALHVALRVPLVAAALARYVRHDPQRWAHRNVHYHDETLKSLEEAREYGRPLSTPAGAEAFVAYLAHSLRPRALRALEHELRRRREAGAGPPVPLQLIYAREDPVVPPKLGPRFGELLPGAEFHWMDRTSHFPQVDRPARFVELLAEFLAR